MEVRLFLSIDVTFYIQHLFIYLLGFLYTNIIQKSYKYAIVSKNVYIRMSNTGDQGTYSRTSYDIS